MAEAACSSPVFVLDNGGCTGPVLLLVLAEAAGVTEHLTHGAGKSRRWRKRTGSHAKIDN